jgi:hypothetical protein
MSTPGPGADVAEWLRGLGLGEYVAVFRENDVGPEVLPKLTTDDLKEIGVRSVGHRRVLLEAVAALRSGSAPPAPARADASIPTAPSVEPTGAERRHLTVLMWTAPGRKACLAFSRERLAPCLSEILLHTITLLITGLRDHPLPQRWSGWKAHGMCTSRLSRDGLALCRPPRLVAVQGSIRPA